MIQTDSASMANTKQRYAVVTGSNKGIGLETVKRLASNGVKVVLTARNQKRGVQAFEKLKKDFGFCSNLVVFHQLDVTDPFSISELVEFVRDQFGRLDILVNNAGINGFNADEMIEPIIWRELSQTYEMAEKCIITNYYGAKETTEAFLPLLKLSDSPVIVNVSSTAGLLKYISNEWANNVLDDTENLTEELIDEVLKEYLKDFKQDSLENNGWPTYLSAYKLSKAAVNSYTRLLAYRHPNMCINCVCPGFVKTDMNRNTGDISVENGAASVVRLALVSRGSSSGLFFSSQDLSSF